MKNKIILILIVLILILTIINYVLITPKTFLKEKIVKFSSENDFKTYVLESRGISTPFTGMGSMAAMRDFEVMEERAAKESYPEERISSTNVQVIGIDEPDLVKTDGLNIYFSPERRFYYYKEIIEKPLKEMPIYQEMSYTKIIKAFPPENLSILSKINETGDLFLTSNTLLILNYNNIHGYDISDPTKPNKKFSIETNGSVVDARLYENRVYIVLKDQINYYKPCPIYSIAINGRPIPISCEEIYHPIQVVPVDVTYTALILNPENGELERSLTFVGSYSSVVYMSTKAIYITYNYYEDMFKIFLNFFDKRARDIIPSNVIERLKEIESYNISIYSKMLEFDIEMEKYKNSLSEEERKKIENELRNRMDKYFEEISREIVNTGIIKIDLENFVISGTGNIPGTPLNQFSLDEYNEYLRIATTVGINSKTENDVYVLDKDLKIVGSVKGLGKLERIYSVRFIGDRGYVVTFRQTDPFYVLDLSDPNNPQVKGELKIPGYSSYLHPIEEHLILGIGKEDWNVKISLFDVSSASEPKEIDKYVLDEYWSDILKTHHAFLIDKKHEIFFLPGNKGGYIFSYSKQNLELKKVITDYETKRALYIDDWLYIIAYSKVVVFNELNWEKVNELEL